MLQADVGDDRRLRGRDHVGGVQAAAQTHLQHHDVTLLLQKELHAHRGHQLELGGGIGHPLRHLQHLLGEAAQDFIRDGCPVDLHPLVEAVKVGRGEQASAQPSLSQDGGCHGRGGPLAIGPGDVDEAQAALRIAQAGQQCLGTLQARLPAGPGPLMDQFNGFLSCHEGVPPCFK